MVRLLLLLLLSEDLLSTRGNELCPYRCICEFQRIPTTTNCSHQELNSFPLDVDFETQVLDLSHNNIRSIPAPVDGLKELRHLSLAHNQLSTLPPMAFNNFSQLRTLDLSNNAIENLLDINADSFLLDAVLLTVLNLSGNPIRELSISNAKGILCSNSLEVLDLSNCNIAHLEGSTVFSQLPNLQVLNLSGNVITWMPNLQSQSLRELDLSHCKMYELNPVVLRGLPRLQKLIVSHNKKFRFNTSSTISSVSLRKLDASFCNLLLEDLKAFPNLTHANLQGNAFEIVLMFENKNLVELDLSENNIKEIYEETFQNLPKLETLNLANNQISNLRGIVFSNNQNLIKLNLSHNSLTNFYDFGVDQLLILDVSYCNIPTLYSLSLNIFPSLLNLNISNNPLEYIPNNFESLTLRQLDLSSCQLHEVGIGNFKSLPLLTYLNLAENKFVKPFSMYVISKNTYLKSMFLSGNPWRCDCKSNIFTLLHNSSTKIVNDLDKVKCSFYNGEKEQSWLRACFEVYFQSMIGLRSDIEARRVEPKRDNFNENITLMRSNYEEDRMYKSNNDDSSSDDYSAGDIIVIWIVFGLICCLLYFWIMIFSKKGRGGRKANRGKANQEECTNTTCASHDNLSKCDGSKYTITSE